MDVAEKEREQVKSVRVPLEISAYAESHRIVELTQELVKGLLIERPEDPLQWLITELERPERQPRVLVLGPPAVGKSTVASRLATELRAIHVTTESLVDNYTDISAQGRVYLDKGQEVPPDLLCALLQQRLKQADCFNR
uniref:Adenylate kinase n=1 Tax=Knipowitschia caucasica TaxID=637954 RepID=A0AAV2JF95_KNICA